MSGLFPAGVRSQCAGGRDTRARLNDRTGADVLLSVAAIACNFQNSQMSQAQLRKQCVRNTLAINSDGFDVQLTAQSEGLRGSRPTRAPPRICQDFCLSAPTSGLTIALLRYHSILQPRQTTTYGQTSNRATGAHQNEGSARAPSSPRMATARLRKTFHYPSDSESASEDLDEEHQEALLTSLASRDATQSTLYRNLFLPILLLPALYFLATIFQTSPIRQKCFAFLSISSLLCTAYVLYFMPVKAPDRKGKRAVWRVEAEEGPVGRYLVALNAVLAGVIMVSSAGSWRKGAMEDAWREALPGSEFYVGGMRLEVVS